MPIVPNKNGNSITKLQSRRISRASSLSNSVLNVSDRAERLNLGSVPFGVAIKGASRPSKGVPVVNVNPLMEAEIDLKRYSTTIV